MELVLRENEEWHGTDEQEKADIIKIFGARQIVYVAPNIPRQVSEPTDLLFPKQDEKVKLVFLSLINPNKNLHLIIDAVKRNERFQLDIYGPVADVSYWKLCQQKMEGEGSIQYHGATPPSNIFKIL